MSAQKKMMTTANPAKSARPVSMIEPLESRKLFSATLAEDGGTVVLAEQTAEAVTIQDISFTSKMSKSSPTLVAKEAPKPPPPMKITLSDVLISSY